jgi:hypothetical protein
MRFPELHSRLHALDEGGQSWAGPDRSSASSLLAPSAAVAAKLLLTWVLALLASASAASIIAERRLRALESEGPVVPEQVRGS